MIIKIFENITIEVPKNCDRLYEFKTAVKYLLEQFPPAETSLPLKLEILFVKKNVTERGMVGDYFSMEREGHHFGEMRVSYGADGNGTLHTLFHEYKHLLQGTEGRLNSDPQLCIEAENWVNDEYQNYLNWYCDKIQESMNKSRSKREIESGVHKIAVIFRDKVMRMTDIEANNLINNINNRLKYIA